MEKKFKAYLSILALPPSAWIISKIVLKLLGFLISGSPNVTLVECDKDATLKLLYGSIFSPTNDSLKIVFFFN